MKAVLASSTLSLAVFIPISGWTADRFGTRRVFASAIGLFTLGSFLCGISSNIHLLVDCRNLQGCGGAMMMPVGRLTLVRTFAKSDLLRTMSFVSIPAFVAPMPWTYCGGLIVGSDGSTAGCGRITDKPEVSLAWRFRARHSSSEPSKPSKAWMILVNLRSLRSTTIRVVRRHPHPKRSTSPPMANDASSGMTPHISGTSLSAQARYAAGTREILECWFEGRPIRNEYMIVDGGKLAGTGAHSYTVTKVSKQEGRGKKLRLHLLARSA
jgi:MFS family permease